MTVTDKLDNQKVQSQESNAHFETTQTKIELSSNESDNEKSQQKSCWTFKMKALVLSIILFVLFGVGLGVGLYFKFRTKLEPIGQPTVLDFGVDGKFGVGNFLLKETNFFSQNQQVELILTQSMDSTSVQGTRFLQTEGVQPAQSDFRAHANIDQTGIQATLTSDQKMGFSIDPQKLANHLIANDPQTRRFLNQISSSNVDLTDSGSMKELQDNLTKSFNEELGTNSSIQFKEVQKFQLKFNTSTSKMQLANGTEVQNHTHRVLVVRLLRWRKFWRNIGRALRKVVVPVVNFVRKSAPIIAGVAGSMIGSALGPVGASIGMSIGTTLGGGVSSLLKACVPKNTLNFQCTKQKAKDVDVRFGMTYQKTPEGPSAPTIKTFDSPAIPIPLAR